MTTQTTQSVFAGLKVVEIASFIAAPAAATMLSDFGADVIKVEPPGLGDPQRLLSSVPPSPAAPGNYSWHLANRNKRGMSVDLKSEGGTEILKRLVEWADVVITNFPHGTREALHLGYEEVSGWNPRVIYADITGFGDAGPDARLPGFDLTAFWSRSGLLASTRDAGAPPTSPPWGSGDYTTATAIYAAITTALYHRERTGRGANVGTSLLADRGVGDRNTGVGGAGRRQAVRAARPHRAGERADQSVPKRRRPLVHAGRQAIGLAGIGQRDRAVGPAVRSALQRRARPSASTPRSWPICSTPNSARNRWRIGKRFSTTPASPTASSRRPRRRPRIRSCAPTTSSCRSKAPRTWTTRSTTRSLFAGWPGCLPGAHPSTESTTTKSSHSWDSASMTSPSCGNRK